MTSRISTPDDEVAIPHPSKFSVGRAQQATKIFPGGLRAEVTVR